MNWPGMQCIIRLVLHDYDDYFMEHVCMYVCSLQLIALYQDYRIEIYEVHDSKDSWGNTLTHV